MKTRKHLALIYPLADFLEMHFSNDPKLVKIVSEKILPRAVQGGKLQPTPAFVLKNILVAVQSFESSVQTNEIVILKPKDRSVQKYFFRPPSCKCG